MPLMNWMDLSTREFDHLPTNAVAILPIAAIEQHGPHLPVGTDTLINRGIIHRAGSFLDESVTALVLPEQAVGVSTEHLKFAGTLSQSTQLLLDYLTVILERVHAAGISRVLIYNTHGGNKSLLYPLALEMRARHDMLVAFSSRGDAGIPSGLFNLPHLEFDIHAGAIETSIMMALHPELVSQVEIRDFVSNAIGYEERFQHLGAGPGGSRTAGYGWMSQDLNPFGACGDARAATPEAGHMLVNHAAKALAGILAEIASANDLLKSKPKN
ncbi:creatininase family protein [Martelella sp. HB161492]|uniref:creatininase family protein n=1 Tax=Martelella sp. HB161492 TaxID=2720726 RepID=UPI001590DB78|nr:creatininase family protein [Martelella sp. HB161492]